MVAVLINGCERGFCFLDGFLSPYDVLPWSEGSLITKGLGDQTPGYSTDGCEARTETFGSPFFKIMYASRKEVVMNLMKCFQLFPP